MKGGLHGKVGKMQAASTLSSFIFETDPVSAGLK